jgi:FkbM family methyltransferase
VNLSVNHLALAARCLYLRRFPVDAGKWRLIPQTLHACQRVFDYPDLRVIRTKYGFKMKVDPSDWLGRHVYVTGDYEPATSNLIWRLLAQGDTFVDVGANIGFFTLLAAKRVGPAGRVVSFEPIPYVREHLAKNIEINRFRNCTVFSEALSDRSGECDFFQGPRDHVGISSLGEIGNTANVLRVETKRLDELLDIQRVSLLKVDVEGAESLVLEGARATLERHKPALIVEITPEYLKRLERSTEDIERLLSSLGYECYAIENNGLRRLRSLAQEAPPQFNAFFRPA